MAEIAQNDNKSDMQSLPGIYDDLLQSYVKILSKQMYNPYQSYFGLVLKSFSPRFQWNWWTSRNVRDFLRVPNTLNIELIGADQILHKIDKFSPQTLDAMINLNAINLKRLRRRSVFSWFNKAAIGFGGIIGLISSLEKLLSFNVSQIISRYVIELLTSGLIGAIIGGVFNMIIVAPMLGLVMAFDDILSVAKAYRSGKA